MVSIQNCIVAKIGFCVRGWTWLAKIILIKKDPCKFKMRGKAKVAQASRLQVTPILYGFEYEIHIRNNFWAKYPGLKGSLL